MSIYDLGEMEKRRKRAEQRAAEKLPKPAPPCSARDPRVEKAIGELIYIAAACARFQHRFASELTQADLLQFGDYANRLKRVADEIKKWEVKR